MFKQNKSRLDGRMATQQSAPTRFRKEAPDELGSE